MPYEIEKDKMYPSMHLFAPPPLISHIIKSVIFTVCDKPTDIEGRYQTPYTTPCDGVVSHWAQIGGLQVFCRPHTQKRKTNALTIFARRAAFSV